ncbi:uncharacterized protein MEPE_05194 [Melanopsichium pennsylvanicum]|uniref:Uncharacterized protein n=2 Tax=Melanopsichium pennsylvanicum TaxID=63383 RepID=A0AAJ4XQ61_9BASI|nr:putative protein [Melanopsichium pennsylvanicum 4]SNX86485.1 uncharacterized protein MEPE_05194 [Melanopsichium pennsylvanicum]
MEQLLSTIFPCCFSHRHSRSHVQRSSDANERTHLIRPASGSSLNSSPNSIADGGAPITTPRGADTRRLKRRHNSILPNPTYDANMLESIIDLFKRKLIALDTAAPGAGTGASASGEQGTAFLLITDKPSNLDINEAGAQQVNSNSSSSSTTNTTDSPHDKHVTPIHTLRLNVSATSRTNDPPFPSQPKLVDIWTEPATTPQPPASITASADAPVFSYSAAVKKGRMGAPKTGKRFGAGVSKPQPQPFPSPKDKQAESSESVEQTTYESLAEIIRCKPLMHDWDLDDGLESAL